MSDDSTPCESNPTHQPAKAVLRVGSGIPMALCWACLRHAVTYWLENETEHPALSIRPLGAIAMPYVDPALVHPRRWRAPW